MIDTLNFSSVCRMSKPNFQAMHRRDLHAYVLSQPEEEAVSCNDIDTLHAEVIWIAMPPLKFGEDLENYPQRRECFYPDSIPRTA